jgi:hypothetical protein
MFVMDSHEELLKKILALSLSNAQLRQEVEQLESNREFLERRFAVNKRSLNGVIEGLPGVLDILILEKPPVSIAHSVGSKSCLLIFDFSAFLLQPYWWNLGEDMLRCGIWEVAPANVGLIPCRDVEYTRREYGCDECGRGSQS